ncbi:malate synthase [Fodinibius sp. SL11]|uniref:malate synthase n=1 Tax=Fodinibius sp. SL11 TaxID=3425690 RepID=UPI003F885201
MQITKEQKGAVTKGFTKLGKGIEINSEAYTNKAEQILTEELVELLVDLHHRLQPERQSLLRDREKRQLNFDEGRVPDYLNNDNEAVTGDWKVSSLPDDLKKRRVEITGPVNSAKMVINMLSRNDDVRADMAMLDFEDSMKPSWQNVVDGFHNVIGAARGDLRFEQVGKNGKPSKVYELDAADMPGVMVRCRGLHLDEENIRVDGEPISAGLFDLAVNFFHTAQLLVDRGRTPKYYVPKCESYQEARWWNTLFGMLEDKLGFETGTLRATFLIETLTAAFQIEEILYEIREHAAGLNVGRWDKIFSDIKVLRYHKDRVMPDRSTIDMSKPWMDQYAKRLIKICHSRGVMAIGGMSAFTPGKNPKLRKEQTEKVLADKKNEHDIGHDGCWISHPYFITSALECFPEENQLDRTLPNQDKYPELLPQGGGDVTEAGLRTNIRVGIAYMQGWNQDIGCVAWDDLMEDLATLEISRAQIWQWIHHKVIMKDGRVVTRALVDKMFDEELNKILDEVEEAMKGQSASAIQKVKKQFSQAREDVGAVFLLENLPNFFNEALKEANINH